MLNDRVTPEFDTDEGLRQGSVLSPLLFSIFIAEVIDEWKRRGIGVRIAGRRLAGLLFADDIVLLAESARELHAALAVMSEHARRWRYSFNNRKCAVMVAGKSGSTGEQWMLSGAPVAEVDSYKYLGVQLQRNSRWEKWQEARAVRGKGAMAALW